VIEELFGADDWRGELADLLQAHELDQLSGVDANLLADALSEMAEALVRLVKDRDRGMPAALSAVERAELAALRRSFRVQEEIVRDLETRLALAEKQRDLAREQRVALG
jgi:hypothetical protein